MLSYLYILWNMPQCWPIYIFCGKWHNVVLSIYSVGADSNNVLSIYSVEHDKMLSYLYILWKTNQCCLIYIFCGTWHNVVLSIYSVEHDTMLSYLYILWKMNQCCLIYIFCSIITSICRESNDSTVIPVYMHLPPWTTSQESTRKCI